MSALVILSICTRAPSNGTGGGGKGSICVTSLSAVHLPSTILHGTPITLLMASLSHLSRCSDLLTSRALNTHSAVSPKHSQLASHIRRGPSCNAPQPPFSSAVSVGAVAMSNARSDVSAHDRRACALAAPLLEHCRCQASRTKQCTRRHIDHTSTKRNPHENIVWQLSKRQGLFRRLHCERASRNLAASLHQWSPLIVPFTYMVHNLSGLHVGALTQTTCKIMGWTHRQRETDTHGDTNKHTQKNFFPHGDGPSPTSTVIEEAPIPHYGAHGAATGTSQPLPAPQAEPVKGTETWRFQIRT